MRSQNIRSARPQVFLQVFDETNFSERMTVLFDIGVILFRRCRRPMVKLHIL